MIGFIFKKIIGSKNDRELKRLWPLVAKINEFEAGLQKLSDDELRQKTADWKALLAPIEDKAELAAKLNEILPEAFALVKNACPSNVRRGTSRCVMPTFAGSTSIHRRSPIAPRASNVRSSTAMPFAPLSGYTYSAITRGITRVRPRAGAASTQTPAIRGRSAQPRAPRCPDWKSPSRRPHISPRQ